MTHAAIRRSAGAVIAGLLLAAGAAVSVAPANADPSADKTFIDYLDKKGVPYKNRTEAILLAKQYCLDTTRQGVETWIPGYYLGVKQKWTQSQTENFINGAIPVYCPKVWGM